MCDINRNSTSNFSHCTSFCSPYRLLFKGGDLNQLMAILAEQMELSDDQQIQWNEDGNGKSVFNIFPFPSSFQTYVTPFGITRIKFYKSCTIIVYWKARALY